MKVIGYGSNYEIYEDDLKTFDKLPVGTYKVRFHKMKGFFLVKTDDISGSEKIYGNHPQRVAKMMKAYDKFDRSLGILMSGDKGIGKSLFAQLLTDEVISRDIPVLLVDTPYFGIAEFIDSVKQEVMVLFDEFEKVFDPNDKEIESQDSLLGLLDGMSHQKRMYVMTVNNVNKVNSFLLNRTGRIHYHLRFEYPNRDEIIEYLKDKISEDSYIESEVEAVVRYSHRVKLSYDSLRAIAFELDLGLTFKEAIQDLNIDSNETYYNVTVNYTEDGQPKVKKFDNIHLDLFASESEFGRHGLGENYTEFKFFNENLQFTDTGMVVTELEIEHYADEDDKQVEVQSLFITRKVETINKLV